MRALFFMALLPLLAFQQGKPKVYSEEQKIAYLISSIGRLDAVFVRNDAEITPKEAMEHLSVKRKKAGNQIKTANGFIAQLATKSSVSGKPYLIKFKDGRTETFASFLQKQLLKLEQTASR